MAVPFLRYLVLLFSYCLKQFVYILIKRNESHSERVCFVVASGVVFGVRLENGKYPTLSLFFVQIASRVYGDS